MRLFPRAPLGKGTHGEQYRATVGAQQARAGLLEPISFRREGGETEMRTIRKTVKVLPGQTKKVKTGNVIWTIKRGR